MIASLLLLTTVSPQAALYDFVMGVVKEQVMLEVTQDQPEVRPIVESYMESQELVDQAQSRLDNIDQRLTHGDESMVYIPASKSVVSVKSQLGGALRARLTKEKNKLEFRLAALKASMEDLRRASGGVIDEYKKGMREVEGSASTVFEKFFSYYTGGSVSESASKAIPSDGQGPAPASPASEPAR